MVTNNSQGILSQKMRSKRKNYGIPSLGVPPSIPHVFWFKKS